MELKLSEIKVFTLECVEVKRIEWQLRCCLRHLTEVQNVEDYTRVGTSSKFPQHTTNGCSLRLDRFNVHQLSVQSALGMGPMLVIITTKLPRPQRFVNITFGSNKRPIGGEPRHFELRLNDADDTCGGASIS
ncbi:hypothetical protein TNCV_3098411 [Trichonephila clavipes]|nr:hypothetical protein TNCV_3098411 [Trichonephila clavipes]